MVSAVPTQDYDIVGSFNNQRISSIDSERTVNMFEYINRKGKKEKSLINTSGLLNTNTSFVSAANGFRAQFTFKGNEYSVIGNHIYLRNLAGATSLLGTIINTNTGYVGVDANTFQVIFVDGVNGYIWDTRQNKFEMITDTSFPVQPIDVTYLDGYFVVANGNTNKFQLSMNDQGLIWGPAQNTFTADSTTDLLTIASTANYKTGIPVQFSTTGTLPAPLNGTDTYYVIQISATTIKVATSYDNAIAGTAIDITTNGTPVNTITSLGQLQQGEITSHPGNIVACRTLHRRLFLFSDFYTEVWENQGIGTNLPFRRNNALLMEYGTPCLGSIAVSFDIMIFQSQTRDGLGPTMQVSGVQALPISNRALDFQFSQYAALGQMSDCRAFLIKENGIIFYRMNFTAANHTWVYNVSMSDPTNEETRRWHEEELLNGDRHPAQTHSYFNGRNYVGSYNSPTLYLLDAQTYTNDGEVIRRMRIGKPYCPPGYQRLRVDRFQVDLLQGGIAQLQPTFLNFILLTESGSNILTETDIEILAEQVATIHKPQDLFVFLSISRDGGQTYGNIIKTPMGAVGQRTFRTLWRKLGTTRRGQSFVPKIEFFDAVPFVIMGAAWAMEVLPE